MGDILYCLLPGDGTHLQHILGNLFRQERLVRLYDLWRLQQFVRAGERFDIDAHKHIFVYALLGYDSTLDEETRNNFIAKYILDEEAEHLFTHHRRNRDLLSQADAMVRQADGRRLQLEMEVLDDGRHQAKAVLSDGTVLCCAESKSWRYERTKATKMALNMLATPFRKELLSNPDYQARVLAREEERLAKRKAAETQGRERRPHRRQGSERSPSDERQETPPPGRQKEIIQRSKLYP